MPIRCRLHGLGQRRQAAFALEPRFLLISVHGVPTGAEGPGDWRLQPCRRGRAAHCTRYSRWLLEKAEMGHTAHNLRCAQLGLRPLIRRLQS
jgi:hypothetical protein